MGVQVSEVLEAGIEEQIFFETFLFWTPADLNTGPKSERRVEAGADNGSAGFDLGPDVDAERLRDTEDTLVRHKQGTFDCSLRAVVCHLDGHQTLLVCKPLGPDRKINRAYVLLESLSPEIPLLLRHCDRNERQQ